MSKNNMIGIIDGDVLIYRACHKSLKENLDVKKTFNEIYQSVKDEVQCDEYSLHVSAHGNFRREIEQNITVYKGKRKEKPTNFKECKEYVLEKYKPISKDGFEADDTASIEAMDGSGPSRPPRLRLLAAASRTLHEPSQDIGVIARYGQ